jgi:predicted transposase YbfD/YdcC
MVVKKNKTANLISIIEIVRNCKLKSFIEYFKDFKDYRDSTNGNFKHHKQDILLLCMVANLCGCESQNSIYRFGVQYHEFLVGFYIYPCYTFPSLSTINRFILKNEFSFLSDQYRLWIGDIIRFSKLNLKPLTISFDGKRIKSDKLNFHTSNQNNITLYSGFINELKVLLNWNVFCGKKSNETVEFSNLINSELTIDDKFKLNIGIVTSDCIYTNQRTLYLLNSNSIGYVFTVKNNTPLLLQSLINQSKELTNTFNEETNRFKTKAHEVEVNIYSVPKNFSAHSNSYNSHRPTWDFVTCGINRFIKVTRTNIKTKKKYVRYYISNIKKNSQEFFLIIRNHWSIENNLHREKDLVFKEDYHNCGSLNSKTFLTSLSNISISLINLHQMGSISQTTKNLSHNLELCMNLLGIEGR